MSAFFRCVVLFCASLLVPAHRLRHFNLSAAVFDNISNERIDDTYPTVDVFYYFLDDVEGELLRNRRQRYSYIVKRMFWVLPMIARRLGRNSTSGPDTRIHIVTNSEDIAQCALARGYFAHRVNEHTEKDKHWLPNVKASLAGTVSPFEYEITILRWILFSEILTKWNDSHLKAERMTRLLFLDGDVMMMLNAARFFHLALITMTEIDPMQNSRDKDDFDYELISFGEGVCNLFSPHGLSSYANFIRQWFDKDVAMVVKESKSLGGIYFSDMELQRLFTYRNMSSRVNYLDVSANRMFLTRQLKCAVSNTVEVLHKKTDTHFHFQGRHVNASWAAETMVQTSNYYHDFGIRIGSEVYSQCFIHFQGIKNKPLLYLYGRAFENFLNFITTRKLGSFEMELLQPNIVFQPIGSRSIFFVNSTLGKKQHVSSMDSFYNHNLSAQDIIIHVPVWLSDMFPTTELHL